jgi:hypothetical protein
MLYIRSAMLGLSIWVESPTQLFYTLRPLLFPEAFLFTWLSLRKPQKTPNPKELRLNRAA